MEFKLITKLLQQAQEIRKSEETRLSELKRIESERLATEQAKARVLEQKRQSALLSRFIMTCWMFIQLRDATEIQEDDKKDELAKAKAVLLSTLLTEECARQKAQKLIRRKAKEHPLRELLLQLSQLSH